MIGLIARHVATAIGIAFVAVAYAAIVISPTSSSRS
jgi:hypothetical protein